MHHPKEPGFQPVGSLDAASNEKSEYNLEQLVVEFEQRYGDAMKRDISMLLQEIVDNYINKNELAKDDHYANGELKEELDNEGKTLLQHETHFIHDVVESYIRWGKEQVDVVLWDIDHTMGENVHDLQRWQPRLVLPYTLEFVTEKFSMQAGILSSEDVQEMLANELQSVRDKFTGPLIGVNDTQLSSDDRAAWPDVDDASRKKYKAFQKLEQTGLTIRLIDDDVYLPEQLGSKMLQLTAFTFPYFPAQQTL